MSSAGAGMPVLFGACTLLGAGLLFLVEPMAAKGLLPVLGGSAAVWTACLVFFQTVLLVGYGYAYALTRALSPGPAGLVHAAVVLIAAALLPWHGFSFASWAGPATLPPSLWVIGVLAASIGVPFFVLSATGPLLQRWIAAVRTDFDPLPLYAVSNASSLAVLIAYPWVVERYLPLSAATPGDRHRPTQVALWCGAFLVFRGALARMRIDSRAALAVLRLRHRRLPEESGGACRWRGHAHGGESVPAGWG